MDFPHASYAALITFAGACARALRRVLPVSWRMRLEAAPPRDLPPGEWIWLHAVSLGELLLAEGLLSRLLVAGYRVHLTTGTVAGRALMEERLPRWDAGTGHLSGGAFPVDDEAGLTPFLASPPALFIALETELWPNLLRSLHLKNIPSVVVNGRLTSRSRGMFVASAIRDLTLVVARDEASERAFKQMGASRTALGGNLKADLPPPPPLHAGWGPLREAWSGDRILVAGNTVVGEEELILEAMRSVQAVQSKVKLILAPRQPRRFDEVASLLESRGFSYRRASDEWPDHVQAWQGCEVLLLDTLGELPRAYGEGTMALVGGGWCAEGGHNPLEPARFGLPVLIGPGFTNFEDLVGPLREARALRIVEAAGLSGVMRGLLEESPLRPVCSPEEPPPHIAELLGALDCTWRLLEPLLPPNPSRE